MYIYVCSCFPFQSSHTTNPLAVVRKTFMRTVKNKVQFCKKYNKQNLAIWIQGDYNFFVNFILVLYKCYKNKAATFENILKEKKQGLLQNN